MKICVVGLGLIGGSMCLALKSAGYAVHGYNRSKKAISYALKNNIIDGEVEEFSSFDVVFVALPPKATINFIERTTFKNGAIVADICGVKGVIAQAICAKQRNFYYVGTHPMAGKEVSGIENAEGCLFKNASMVICSDENTNIDAINTIKALTKDMGFKRIVECSTSVHDKKIAYTSQLAHVVSNCYVKNKEIESCLGFTGGSFQDMTRIAGVDEAMWAELYLLNKQNLLEKCTLLINSLTEFKNALSAGDEGELINLLSIGSKIFQDGKANSFAGEDIKVITLY
ncbi:MAG: prephenate dehydrogenase [Clostridiales bacterium]|nr:prephenate dehydrogenase [Clostridiales bacterium]